MKRYNFKENEVLVSGHRGESCLGLENTMCAIKRALAIGVDMIEIDKYGYYHATNEGGYISWYDFCFEIYKQAGLNTKVIPVTTFEYGLSKASRPFNSRLDKSKLSDNGFERLPDWKDALSRYLKESELV